MISKVIQRPYYIRKLMAFRNNGLIKVIMGPRRCGKSFLLKMFQNQLQQNGISAEQLISIDLEDLALAHLREPMALHQYILSQVSDNKPYYVFIGKQLSAKAESFYLS